MADGMRRRRGGAAANASAAARGGAAKAAAAAAADGGSTGPSFFFAFALLALVRVLSSPVALVSADCDEAFNYWEPTHYLMHGEGFQTWEYSPLYAIRSWSYPLLHAVVGQCLASFLSKVHVYFGIRAVLALLCAVCEGIFVSGIRKQCGAGTAYATILFLALSPALFISASSFLPSSFAMYGVLLAYGCWFHERYAMAVTAAAAATIIPCWPFVGIVFCTIALDVMQQSSIFKFLGWSLLSLVYFLVPALFVDYVYYNRLVAPVLNIVLYNYTTSHGGGAQLYGEEPWHFYFQNLALNINVALPLALVALPSVMVFRGWHEHLHKIKRLRLIYYLTPTLMWLALMIVRPHKEERFLFVIYPLLCFSAALAGATLLCFVRCMLERVVSSLSTARSIVRMLGAIVLLAFVLLSLSRSAALVHNYSASGRAFLHVATEADMYRSPGTNMTVCVGKEWYRFPSSFFLPPGARLGFLKSGFGGQLPKPFSPDDGTSKPPAFMNDMNREEPSRYIAESECDLIVDLDLPHQSEKHYAASGQWRVAFELPFLDAHSSTSRIARAFFIPGFSPARNAYAPYQVLVRSE